MNINPSPLHRVLQPFAALVWLCLLVSFSEKAGGFQDTPADTRCVLVEYYYNSSQAADVAFLSELNQYAESKGGLEVVPRDLHLLDKNRARLQKLVEHFKFEKERVPILYTCNRIIHPLETGTAWKKTIEDALVMDVYTRAGCSRCAAAKKYLEQLLKRYPAFQVRYRELTNDVHARNDLEQLVERFHRAATSTPVLHLMDSLIVGFDHENTSGPRIEGVLKKWTVDCKARKKESSSETKPQSSTKDKDKVSEVTAPVPF